MRKHPLRQGQIGSHQERRPVNRMKAQDILADHMKIGRPARLIGFSVTMFAICGPAGGGDIVGQRIKPDIHHMGIIIRYRHTPGEAGAAYRQIA